MKSYSKDFIDIFDFSKSDLEKIISFAKFLKKKDPNVQERILKHKTLAMIFEKSSTRTRISFEVAITQLGGKAIVMNKNDMQLGKGETIEDTAEVISRYVDAIMIRSYEHSTITKLAEHSSKPVINALSNYSHPCQIMSAILTFEEKIGNISEKILVWVGDQNNVLNSYIHACYKFGFELVISTPDNLDFSKEEIKKYQSLGAKVKYVKDPKEAVINADVIITDTWFSMGDGSEDQEIKEKKIKLLSKYQVNKQLMVLTRKKTLFSHCLPLYRGYEVDKDILDTEQSVIFDEAENRLHMQKSILTFLLNKEYFDISLKL